MTKDISAGNTLLGSIIKSHRMAQGRSARDVAREANIDIHTMTKLEQGAYASPSPMTLRGVAQALGIPVLHLFQAAGYLTPHDLLELSRSTTTMPVFNAEQAAANERKLEDLVAEHGAEFDFTN